MKNLHSPIPKPAVSGNLVTVLVPPIVLGQIIDVHSIRVWSSGAVSIQRIDGSYEGCVLSRPEIADIGDVNRTLERIVRAVESRRPDTLRTPLPIIPA